ncbi:YcjF family protein [Sphingorhabdus sp.]|uniref:YcjF family protein n=1 Tax=Sphingorhabdus sp. TaxID=1902408 RepID=UPI0037CC985A
MYKIRVRKIQSMVHFFNLSRGFIMTEKKESADTLPEMAANDTNAGSPELSRREQASKSIKRYSAASAGFGIIPIPALDITAIGTSQFLMIRSVAKIYGLDLSKDRVRAIVSTTVGGVAPVLLGGGLSSIFKMIPVVGTIVGAVTLPSIAGLTTLTLGNALADHLDAGGSLDELGLAQLRATFNSEFRAAKAKLSRKKQASVENTEALAA